MCENVLKYCRLQTLNFLFIKIKMAQNWHYILSNYSCSVRYSSNIHPSFMTESYLRNEEEH